MHYFSLRTFISLTTVFTTLFTISCQKSRTEQVEYVRNSVVLIHIRSKIDNNGVKDTSLGTGFFITENLIATAYHLSKDIEEEKKIK
jgi:hypothetical protein